MTLKLGNGASVTAKAIGSTSIDLYDHVLLLDSVLYIPNTYKNIIYISSLSRKNYEFHFNMYLRDISGPLKTPLPIRNPSNKGFPFPT